MTADRLLVRLALHPPRDRPLCLGATLSGTLDFRGSQEAAAADPALPKCVQVSVLLETEEKVHARWSSGAAAGIRKARSSLIPNYMRLSIQLLPSVLKKLPRKKHFQASTDSSSPALLAAVQVQDEHQQLTPDTVLTHFMLSVPPDAPASFSSHLVALRWVLRFEFTTSRKQSGGGWLLGSSGTATERLIWSLPVLVQPAR